MKNSRTFFFIVLPIIAMLLALVISNRTKVWHSDGCNASEIPWSKDIVSTICRNEIAVESHYYPSRNHHYLRVFGRTNDAMFQSFSKTFSTEALSGDLWNERVAKWAPYGYPDGFRFAADDIGFIAVAPEPNGRRGIEGVYSRETGIFFLQIKTLVGK